MMSCDAHISENLRGFISVRLGVGLRNDDHLSLGGTQIPSQSLLNPLLLCHLSIDHRDAQPQIPAGGGAVVLVTSESSL